MGELMEVQVAGKLAIRKEEDLKGSPALFEKKKKGLNKWEKRPFSSAIKL